MDLYKKDSAERTANLTTTSLELILEQNLLKTNSTPEDKYELIQAFNIIMSQPILQQNIEESCLLASSKGKILAMDKGEDIYSFFLQNNSKMDSNPSAHQDAIVRYSQIKDDIMSTEQIHTILESEKTLHIFVPFVPKGEYEGSFYFKITPNISSISKKISTVYDETILIFTALILFGLLAIFYITSNTVKEREQMREVLFKDRENQIKEKIAHQKEALFTKRIYHAHHKAEKIMGFIKSDVNSLSKENISDFKYKVEKYVNFVSRVIYDMKWYDPPLHVIRNSAFSTNINETIKFLVDNIFCRVYSRNISYSFNLDLDGKLPEINVNEYVVWEVLEPLIQNCIDHNRDKSITIFIKTVYYESGNMSEILIEDNGKGFPEDLLSKNEMGISKIFLEHTTMKEDKQSSGYGCYIAHEIGEKRCGWKIHAENVKTGGAKIVIKIYHSK
jgi:anti-sigma regulatory factor (Ser/Thr protein kinase)